MVREWIFLHSSEEIVIPAFRYFDFLFNVRARSSSRKLFYGTLLSLPQEKVSVMKTFIVISIAFFASLGVLYAQDTTKTPIPQDDPVMKQSSEELQRNLLKDMVKITSIQLPEGVKKALESNELKGAKVFYKHKAKDEYAVEVREGEVSTFKFFDKDGNPINDRKN